MKNRTKCLKCKVQRRSALGYLLDPFVRSLFFFLYDVSGDGVATVVAWRIPGQRDGVFRRRFAFGRRTFARGVVRRLGQDRLIRLQWFRESVGVLNVTGSCLHRLTIA